MSAAGRLRLRHSEGALQVHRRIDDGSGLNFCAAADRAPRRGTSPTQRAFSNVAGPLLATCIGPTLPPPTPAQWWRRAALKPQSGSESPRFCPGHAAGSLRTDRRHEGLADCRIDHRSYRWPLDGDIFARRFAGNGELKSPARRPGSSLLKLRVWSGDRWRRPYTQQRHVSVMHQPRTA